MRRLDKIKASHQKYIDWWLPIDIAGGSFLAPMSLLSFCENLLVYPNDFFDRWTNGYNKRDVLHVVIAHHTGFIDLYNLENLEKNMFNQTLLPQIKNVQPKLIGDEIQSVTPKNSSIIEKEYKNHWGDTVIKYEDSMFAIVYSSEPHYLYGDWGHDFLYGFYVIDENEKHIYADQPGYKEIMNKSKDMWDVLDGLIKNFPSPDFQVERGRGDRIVVNDKIIKGILLHPGMKIKSVDDTIEAITEFINLDIKNNRIIPGKFGV